MTMQPPPSGQGPIDPRSYYAPPQPQPYPPPHYGPPAGYPYPPPMMPMPQYMMPRRSGGIIRGIFTALVVSIFSASLLMNVYLLMALGLTGGGGTEEQAITTGKTDPNQRIVVMPIKGVIMDAKYEQVHGWMKTLENDKHLRALVLEIDSPGGGVTASDRIRAEIAEFKAANPNIPIVVIMDGTAASGGYYIATAADHIVAQETTLTGSIGVRMDMYNISELAQKWGVSENSITAPKGGHKNDGSMFQPMDAEQRAYFQGIVDDAYDRFKTLVKDSRKTQIAAAKANIDEICSGRIFTAKQALANGLVDELGYEEKAYQWAAKQAGLSSPTIIRLKPRLSFISMFGSADDSSSSSSSSARASAGGLSINLNRDLLDELRKPQLMYMFTGE